MRNFLNRIRPRLVFLFETINAIIGGLITYGWSLTQIASTFDLGLATIWLGINLFIFMLMILFSYANNPIDRFFISVSAFSYGILVGLVGNGIQNFISLHQISGLYDVIIYTSVIVFSVFRDLFLDLLNYLISVCFNYIRRTQRP